MDDCILQNISLIFGLGKNALDGAMLDQFICSTSNPGKVWDRPNNALCWGSVYIICQLQQQYSTVSLFQHTISAGKQIDHPAQIVTTIIALIFVLLLPYQQRILKMGFLFGYCVWYKNEYFFAPPLVREDPSS